MKKKKLLSAVALALMVATCTSVSASASTSVKQTAIQAIVTNGLNGGQVFKDVKVTAKTPVGDYLTANFIKEANDVLGEYEIEIEANDDYYAVQKKIALKIRSLDEAKKSEALAKIKKILNDKLDIFVDCNDRQLKSKINYYFNTSKYGTLTVGRNLSNAKTVSLEDSKGNILVQVNSSNVYKAKEKLDSVNNYEELKALISSYYTNAENYFDSIK